MKFADKTHKKNSSIIKNYYFTYTIVFAIFFLTAFAAFFINGKGLVWRTDGLLQHYPNLLYLRKWAEEVYTNIFTLGKYEIPMWDMTLGEGGSVLNVLSFRPLYWLSLLCPVNKLEYYYWFRVVISVYLSGISFSLFCKKFKRLDFACLIGSIVYIFSGFILCYAFKHAFFIEFTILLPLILLGTEKILRKESPWVFVFSVAIAGISYFYTLYMITAFAVIYAAIRFLFINDNRTVKTFFGKIGIFTFFYLIGLGIAAVSLLPNMLLAFSSNRVNNTDKIGLTILYDLEYYLSLITSFLDTGSTGNYGYLAFSAIVMFELSKLFLTKDKDNRRNKQLRIMALLGLLFILFPIFAFLFNGGGGITNRWFFAIAFGSAVLTAFGLETKETNSLTRIEENRFFTAIGLYCTVALIFSLFTEIHIEYWIFLCIYLVLYLGFKYGLHTPAQIYRYRALLLLVLLFETGYKAYGYYGESNYVSEFLNQGTVEHEIYNVAAYTVNTLEDDSVYRVDSVEEDWNSPYLNRNYGQRVGINGISSYYGYMPSGLASTLDELGLSQRYQAFAVSSYDQRTVLNELSAVKYLAVRSDKASYVPYGYEFLGDTEGISTYKNEYALPIIYAYSSVISKDTYNSLPANKKEQAMLQGAVMEEGLDNDEIPVCNLQFDDEVVLSKDEIYAQIEQQGNAELKETGIYFNTPETFRLELPYDVTGEIYVLFEGVVYDCGSNTGSDSGLIHAALNDTWKKGYVFGKNHQYYSGKKDLLLNLGYVESCSSPIILDFPVAGEYIFDNIQIIMQPMERYEEKVAQLMAPVYNISMETNYITADVELSEPEILCVAIPYENGWNAFANGERVSIQQLNGRYMGIELAPGQYYLELKYSIPGLKIGFYISVVSILISVITAINLYFYKKEEEEDA